MDWLVQLEQEQPAQEQPAQEQPAQEQPAEEPQVDIVHDPGFQHAELDSFRVELKNDLIYRMELKHLSSRDFDGRNLLTEMHPLERRQVIPPPRQDNLPFLLTKLKRSINLQGERFLSLSGQERCLMNNLPNEIICKILRLAVFGEDVLALERFGRVSRSFYCCSVADMQYSYLLKKAFPEARFNTSKTLTLRNIYLTTPHPYFNGFYASRTNQPSADSLYPNTSQVAPPSDYYFFYRVLRLQANGNAIYSEITEESGSLYLEDKKQYRRTFKGKWTLTDSIMRVSTERTIQKAILRVERGIERYAPIDGKETYEHVFEVIPDHKYRYDLHYVSANFSSKYEDDPVTHTTDHTGLPHLMFFPNTDFIYLATNF